MALAAPNRGAELLALKGASVNREVTELASQGGFDIEVLDLSDPAGGSATVARVRRSG
jgi:hypothetical protein